MYSDNIIDNANMTKYNFFYKRYHDNMQEIYENNCMVIKMKLWINNFQVYKALLMKTCSLFHLKI